LAIQDVNAKHSFIVTPSAKEHPYNKNVRVVNLPVALQKLQKLGLLGLVAAEHRFSLWGRCCSVLISLSLLALHPWFVSPRNSFSNLLDS
jgi:hypothetical protein